MNEIYGLYCVCESCEVTPERVRYVGQTTRGSATRFRFHRYDALAENYSKKSDLPVYRWMRKHGVDNIRYRVLEEVQSTGELDQAEIKWVEKLKTFSMDGLGGMNLARGGASVRGYRHSEEVREKMKGRKYTQETRDRMSRSAKLRGMDHLKPYLGVFRGEKSANATMTDDTATKIKSMLWDGFAVREVAESFGVGVSTVNHLLQGRTWKHIQWPTDRPRTESSAHKRSQEARRGVPLAEETKRKLSKSISKAWEDPERRERGSKAVSGELNPSAKLSEEKVRYIRAQVEAGRTYSDLSRELGLSAGAVSKVARGITWKHVK